MGETCLVENILQEVGVTTKRRSKVENLFNNILNTSIGASSSSSPSDKASVLTKDKVSGVYNLDVSNKKEFEGIFVSFNENDFLSDDKPKEEETKEEYNVDNNDKDNSPIVNHCCTIS